MQFPCPTCKAPLLAQDTEAGTKVQCPHCGQRILLPATPRPAAENKTVLVNLDQPATVPPGLITAAPVGAAPDRPRAWWKKPGNIIPIVGASVLVVVLVVVLVILLRKPTYTVPELVKGYHAGMVGQRVRVTGIYRVSEPSRTGGGITVLLVEPGTNCAVAAANIPAPRQALRPDQRLSVSGIVARLLTGQPDIVVLESASLD
jgi:DNA-directed RNA polymerase subunit RPC12/RpoP